MVLLHFQSDRSIIGAFHQCVQYAGKIDGALADGQVQVVLHPFSAVVIVEVDMSNEITQGINDIKGCIYLGQELPVPDIKGEAQFRNRMERPFQVSCIFREILEAHGDVMGCY